MYCSIGDQNSFGRVISGEPRPGSAIPADLTAAVKGRTQR